MWGSQSLLAALPLAAHPARMLMHLGFDSAAEPLHEKP